MSNRIGCSGCNSWGIVTLLPDENGRIKYCKGCSKTSFWMLICTSTIKCSCCNTTSSLKEGCYAPENLLKDCKGCGETTKWNYIY